MLGAAVADGFEQKAAHEIRLRSSGAILFQARDAFVLELDTDDL